MGHSGECIIITFLIILLPIINYAISNAYMQIYNADSFRSIDILVTLPIAIIATICNACIIYFLGNSLTQTLCIFGLTIILQCIFFNIYF